MSAGANASGAGGGFRRAPALPLPELAADVAALQDEAERLWMELRRLLDKAGTASARLVLLEPDEPDDDGWEWASLARRSGLVGLRNTLVDFRERLDVALWHIDSSLSNGWPFGPGQTADRKADR